MTPEPRQLGIDGGVAAIAALPTRGRVVSRVDRHGSAPADSACSSDAAPCRRSALTLVIACCAPLASAQPKAALTQDRDEPGRNPSQQLIQLTQNTTNCGALLSLCDVAFDVVPAGKRLVVTYASVVFHADPASSNLPAYVGPAQIPTFSVALPLPQARGGTRHVTNGPVLFFVDAGAYPYAIVQAFPLTDGGTVWAAISGYYVSVP